MSALFDLNAETLEHLYEREPLCVEPDMAVSEAFRQMNALKKGGALVCRDGVLVGIFTERDAISLMADAADLDVPIERVMTKNPVALSIHDTVAAAIEKMAHGGYRRLPIVDANGVPTGFVGATRILHYLVDHFPATVYNLPPSPHHATETREGA